MLTICKLSIFGHLVCCACILTMFLLLKVLTQTSAAESNGVGRSRKGARAGVGKGRAGSGVRKGWGATTIVVCRTVNY